MGMMNIKEHNHGKNIYLLGSDLYLKNKNKALLYFVKVYWLIKVYL